MKLLKYVAGLVVAMALTACGGGGGNPGTGPNEGQTPVTSTLPIVSLALIDSANSVATTITPLQEFTLQAKVINATGLPLEGQIVTFAGDPTLVAFSPVAGTARTGTDGVASLKVSPALATLGGALNLTADVTVAGTAAKQATLGVTVLQQATGNAPAIVEVLTSANTLLSSGSEALITAFVKNSANVGLATQAVSFSASSGALQVTSLVTDLTGAVTAKLIAGANKSVRDITVTVTSGSASGSVVVPVTGTRVSISGSGSLQAGGAAAQYTVRAVDSSNNPVSKAQITVQSKLGNSISPASLPLTDATGTTSFLYTPNNAGTDTLTITGLGARADSAVVVNAIDFVVLSPASNTTVVIGTAQTVRVQFMRSGVGVAGQTVAFSTTRGTIVAPTTTTDASGLASAVLSSTTAGPADVVAQISGVGSVNLPLQFVATTPTTIVVQANPGSVLPNTSGTTNQSTIEAVVRDVNGNPVANRQVNFTALQDLSNGSLSPGIATTDANGRAQVQFIPGASSTQANGVTIQAQVASTLIRGTTSLTVNGRALFITIAFGNTMSNLDETTYTKTFSVYVTDANGVAVGNQVITLSAIPTEYYKGTLSNCVTTTVAGVTTTKCGAWAYSGAPTICPNEDRNLDGILNTGEDTNRNGQLTPGNIVVTAPGSVTTDASGRAAFAIQYGEQFAPWATIAITARATVAGTESRQSISFGLVGLASDFDAETPPAGAVSPFGSSGQCTDSN